MAIVTAAIWQAYANITVTGSELASIEIICAAVDKAIKNRLKRTIEQQTFTSLIMDAPDTPTIQLGRYAPITIASFQCWMNGAANGNPAAFTTDNLLEMYTDYRLDVDPVNPLLSPGNLERVGNVWGISYRRRPGQLSYNYEPNRGAIKLTFQGGYAPDEIPTDIVQAACIAVTQLMGNRKYGYQLGSESWNGYSYNIPGVGLLANGTLGSADILGLLQPYVNYADTIGG